MRELATQPVPDPAQAGRGLLRRSSCASSYASRWRLSPALRDKKTLGCMDLEALPSGQHEHFLVYLPQPEQSHKYALLPQRAAEILAALETPCAPTQLPGRLRALGFAPHAEDDGACLVQLKHQQAILGWDT